MYIKKNSVILISDANIFTLLVKCWRIAHILNYCWKGKIGKNED